MNVRFLASALGVLAAAHAGASAEIYRCRDAGGVTYQETPCAGEGGTANIPTAFPEANYAERDRLLRREAELDARLLKRAEIDARVQIAREERLAREGEAELQRQAAADTAAAGGVIVLQPFAAPYGASFHGHRRAAPRILPRWF